MEWKIAALRRCGAGRDLSPTSPFAVNAAGSAVPENAGRLPSVARGWKSCCEWLNAMHLCTVWYRINCHAVSQGCGTGAAEAARQGALINRLKKSC